MTEARTIAPGYGAVATMVAAIAVYALALGNGFAFDDAVLIPGDPRVVGGHIGQLLAKPYWTDPGFGLYRPLTSITFALDWALSNGAAAWFHFSNVVWHALASLLVYLLLTRFFRPAAALAGSLVFALHPVHVEAVANVVGRSELIAAVFFLAACLVWTEASLTVRARVTLTALCYGLAMLAKESAVVLPAVLLLLDATQLRPVRACLRRRGRDYALLTAVLLLFLLIRWRVLGDIAPTRLDPSLEVTTGLGDRLLTALQAWPVALRLLVFPRTLLADYGPRILMPISQWTLLALLGLFLLAATTIGGVWALLRGSAFWALGLLWFPITILTVSNLIIPVGVLVAERTLYLPSFALSFGIAAAVSQVPTFAAWQLRWALVVVLALLAVRTAVRVPEWKSTESIMLALVRDRPESFRGQWVMARMARAQPDPQRALALYAHALQLWPYRERVVQEAALYASTQRQDAWAQRLAAWGVRRWPDNVNFRRMLVAHAIDVGDTIAARRELREALRIAPADTVLNQMWQAFGRTRTVP